MRSFPSKFETERNKIAGANPVWILKINFNEIDYYISDRALSVEYSGGTITTLPWVLSWGTLNEGTTGELGDYSITDINITLGRDISSDTDIIAIANSNNLESCRATLYLTFKYSNPYMAPDPQAFFSGFIRDVKITDSDSKVDITIEDDSLKLNSFVGYVVSSANHPLADPDDIGKIAPVIFGTVSKIPILATDSGVMTALAASVNASSASFYCDPSILSVGMVLQIDDEQVSVTGKYSNYVTVTRGVNTTVAASHLKGAALWEDRATPFKYMVSSTPVLSIDKVWARSPEGRDIDITSICTLYPSGSATPSDAYYKKAYVTIPGRITAAQAASLAISDGINVYDGITVSDTIAVVDGIGVSDSIGISDSTHYNSLSNMQRTEATYNSPVVNEGSVTGYQTRSAYVDFYNTESGNRASVTMSVDVIFEASYTYDWAIHLCDGSYNRIHTIASGTGSSNPNPKNYTFEIPSDHLALNKIEAVIGSSNIWIGVQFNGAQRTITLANASTGYSSANVSKSGSASKSGSVVKSGNASKSGSASKSGTVTLSGNSVANTMIADLILVDVTSGPIINGIQSSDNSPENIIAGLLQNYSNISGATCNQIGNRVSSYTMNGAITEYNTVLFWIHRIAFETGSVFKYRVNNGIPGAYLMEIPTSCISSKEISSGMVGNYSRSKSSWDDIINKIDVRFDRDFSKSKDITAYRQTLGASDSSSITKYGTREKPDRFCFDFVTDPTRAAEVRDVYLSRHKNRRWILKMDLYLDNIELEFFDQIKTPYLYNEAGLVTGSEISPGSENELDRVIITVEIPE